MYRDRDTAVHSRIAVDSDPDRELRDRSDGFDNPDTYFSLCCRSHFTIVDFLDDDQQYVPDSSDADLPCRDHRYVS